MEIIIISGRSGGGKSVALRALEDMGYYCVDNLPLDLLPKLIEILSVNQSAVAISLDIRNLPLLRKCWKVPLAISNSSTMSKLFSWMPITAP